MGVLGFDLGRGVGLIVGIIGVRIEENIFIDMKIGIYYFIY